MFDDIAVFGAQDGHFTERIRKCPFNDACDVDRRSLT
jgi:hypothetical protein